MSKTTMCFSVRAKSCSIGLSATGILRRARDPACPVDDEVPYVVPCRVVGDRVQLVGRGVELGVRGEGAAECPAEVVGLEGVEFAVQFVRQRPALLHGEDAALVGDHMGVAGEVVVRDRAGAGVRLAQLLADGGRSHPPVAVPLGAALAQAYAVHHSLSEHPVVGAWVLQTEDVGSGAQVTAVQGPGDAAGDGQVEGGQLLGDGGERAFQERVVLRCGSAPAWAGRRRSAAEAHARSRRGEDGCPAHDGPAGGAGVVGHD